MKSICLALTGLFAAAMPHPALAQDPLDAYCATLSAADHAASDGLVLTDAASILRQDRANYHALGKRDPGDEGDSTFASKARRAKIPAMLDAGNIDPAVRDEIVNATPDVCVQIHADAIDVAFKAELPFLGTWNCEVATFAFTATTYNNGSEDIPIQEIQEGSDGSYTLFLPDDYMITLSGFATDRMGWFSPASGDSFQCTRVAG